MRANGIDRAYLVQVESSHPRLYHAASSKIESRSGVSVLHPKLQKSTQIRSSRSDVGSSLADTHANISKTDVLLEAKRQGPPWQPMGLSGATPMGVIGRPLGFSGQWPMAMRNHEKHETFRNSSFWNNSDILAPPPGEPVPVLMALGGGTGASIGGTGSSAVDRDLLRRMHYQDKAVMLLVLAVYVVALLFSANLTYRQACNSAPVAYYADPRFHNLVMEGHDLDVFLETFNQPPKNISLQVTGFLQVSSETSGSVRWRGNHFHIAFTFSLDLSPWVVRDTEILDLGPMQQTRSLQDGVLPEDRSSVHHYLLNNNNDLAYVEILKKVDWPDFEELATNIKHQIRQSGFTGVISVERVDSDDVHVYKNKSWANFMHSRATRVLCALSIVGWLLYVPYMWARCKKIGMRSYCKVDVGIAEYWALIADKLTADGFQESPSSAELASRASIST